MPRTTQSSDTRSTTAAGASKVASKAPAVLPQGWQEIAGDQGRRSPAMPWMMAELCPD